MERQNYFISIDTKIRDNLFMIQFNYKSEYNGNLRLRDTNARQHVSDYACQIHMYKDNQIKGRYQCMISNDAKSNVVWPISAKLSELNNRTFPLNGRCWCAFQLIW